MMTTTTSKRRRRRGRGEKRREEEEKEKEANERSERESKRLIEWKRFQLITIPTLIVYVRLTDVHPHLQLAYSYKSVV